MEPLLFLIYWLLNSLAIGLTGLVFSSSVVLGNARLLPLEASIYAGFWVTFFVWTMWEYVLVRKVKLEPYLLRFFFFFFVNSLGIWLVSRYAERYTGLGLVSFWWALMLGGITTLLQNVSWNLGGKKLKD